MKKARACLTGSTENPAALVASDPGTPEESRSEKGYPHTVEITSVSWPFLTK